MENTQAEPNSIPPNCCIACQNPNYDQSYKTKLCVDCRNHLLKVKAPLWVKIFAIVVAAITLAGIVMMPKNFSLALHLERAKKAENNHRYVSAAREYEIVQSSLPRELDYKIHLFQSYFMSGDYYKASIYYDNIQGHQTEDLQMANVINAEVEQLRLVYDDTSAYKIDQTASSDTAAVRALTQYYEANPGSQVPLFLIAERLFDMGRFDEAFAFEKKLFELNPNYINLIELMAATQRESGKYDEAISLYNQALENNAENVGAITGKCRTELKRKNDAVAKEDLDEAIAIDPNSSLTKEALILYNFFTGKTNEAKSQLEAMRKQTIGMPDTIVYERTRKIIEGEKKFR